MTQAQRVNPLAEAAVLASLTVVMGALAVYFLPFKFLIDFAWGIPAIIIIKRHDLKTGILMLVAAGFLTLFFTGPLTAGLLYIELAPLAIAYGILFNKEAPPGVTLLTGLLISGLSTVALLLLLLAMDPAYVMPSEEQLRQQTETVVDLYKNLGIVTEENADYFANMSVNLVRILIPASFVFFGFIRAFVTYILAVRVLRKLEIPVNPLPPFSQWRLPWYFVWLVIAGLGLTLIGDHYKLAAVAMVGKVTLFSVWPLFFIIGLAVITHFFKLWKIPTWLKVLLIITAILNWVGSVLLCTIIGIFDPLFSFRNRRKPKE